ncbi:unknown [Clostridium sp. CAG:448]|nr:unknown [Clostridium sp. CAG:448]
MTNGAENKKKAKAREPLFHVARRASMPVWQAWLIRVAAFSAGKGFFGVVSFLLVCLFADQIGQRESRICEGFLLELYQGFVFDPA